jgi:RNA polymerase sigma-70 factor (ECF subfamily)
MPSKHVEAVNDASGAQADLAEVLAGCRAGEREAQRCLFERCRHRVYRLMVRMVGIQDAADLTQQVFLQMFRKIDQFTGLSKFDTWLYRLAVNEALQHLRKGSRWKFQTLSRDPASDQTSPGERHEYQELLDHALARLEPELRSIFVLRAVDGLSYREIAKALDLPEGTVGSRLNRARSELQEYLAELGWEP